MSTPYPSTNQPSRATLLGLPRELRDEIYLHLIPSTPIPAPSDPDNAGPRLCPPNWNSPCAINFEATSPRPTLLQLKLCSRQLHAEVTDVLLLAGTGARQACLDLMVRGSAIWPTWTYLPLSAHLDPVVKITLRLFGARGFGSEFSTVAYRGLWSLFNLLVSHGPCFIHASSGLTSPLRIGRLKFDIFLCFPASVDDLFGTYRQIFDRLEQLARDNVGLGAVETIEACMGLDRRVWRLKQLLTGLTLPSRIE